MVAVVTFIHLNRVASFRVLQTVKILLDFTGYVFFMIHLLTKQYDPVS